MPVKYGPKGFTSPSIRRYHDREHAADGPQLPTAPGPRVRPSSVLGALLAFGIVAATAAYVGRPAPANQSFTAIGNVVAKETNTLPNGIISLRLTISIPLHTGVEQTLTIECNPNAGEKFQRGERVIVHYTGGRGATPVTITELTPAATEVEL